MGRYLFRLPDIGEGVAEAEIVAWHVKPGDRVSEDQTLVDVMTDKATVDMTSPVDGVVTRLHGDVGAMAPVGSILLELEVEGGADAEPAIGVAHPEALASPIVAPPAAAEGKTEKRPPLDPAPAAAAAAEPPPERAHRARAHGDPPLAAPATRRRAYELGVPLQFVPGTGPGGRISPEDLEAYLLRGPQAPGGARHARRDDVEAVRFVGLRRRIAEKMQESKRRIPHFSYVEECDVTELERLRETLNSDRDEARPKLTLLPFIMRAVVAILPNFPQVNARFDDDAGVLQVSGAVHMGIATQTPGGLMVPVVRHAEARDLWDCAAELRRVTAAARSGDATRDELTGSTITITSLGPLGGIAATPVINHPEVAIIGPNKIIERPIIHGGQIAVRKMMNLSSSFDHRVVDGYDAARFIQALKRRLEHPALIFMD